MSLGTENGTQLTMPVMPAYGGVAANNGGGNGMWGDCGWWVLIILFAMIWGWGGNGFGNGNNGGATNAFLPYAVAGNGALTRSDLCQDMSFAELQNGVRNVNDAVATGFANLNSTICHQQYDTAMLVNGINNNINGVQGAVNDGFSRLNSTICQQQYETAQQINGVNNNISNGFNAANVVALQNANAANVVALQNANAIQSQLADCCCTTKQAIAETNYNMASQACDTRNLLQANANATQNIIQSTTRDMIDNQNANTRAILDKLDAQAMAAKDAQIAAQNQKIFGLELAASQSQQNAYLINTLRPTPVPCYPASSPCGYNWSPNVLSGGYGYNNGCGCGC